MDYLPESELILIKKKLRTYSRKEIEFNEPHFSQQLALRDGNREEVIGNLLNPERLILAYIELGKYNDIKYSLYFTISNSKTMKLPIIFKNGNKKSLYVITYIMRYRGI